MESMTPVFVALIFHIIDLLTGIVSAVRNKDLDSGKMRDGLFKKIGFLFCYLVAYIIDGYGTQIGMTLSIKLLPAIVLYTVTTEVISIIENISKINPDLLPEKLMDLFHIHGGEK